MRREPLLRFLALLAADASLAGCSADPPRNDRPASASRPLETPRGRACNGVIPAAERAALPPRATAVMPWEMPSSDAAPARSIGGIANSAVDRADGPVDSELARLQSRYLQTAQQLEASDWVGLPADQVEDRRAALKRQIVGD